MHLEIEVHTGKESPQLIDVMGILARLRMDFFKEFPYLYQGDFEAEKKYARTYLADEQSMIVVAKVDSEFAGIFTGIPLASKTGMLSDLKDLILKNGHHPEEYYYYGEMLILPKFRRLGLAKKMFAAQDEMIRLWKYKYACALTVVRETNHPLIPANYESYDRIWERAGLHKNGMKITYRWPTIQFDGSVIDTDNELELWVKSL